ncbi:MAG: hypothetical protein ACTSPG_05045 [Candidatus Hodarchaeales archaeon]
MFEPESDDVRTIKALPLWQSALAAIVAPIVIAIVFGILGSKTNPLLMQIELILVAIGFCLTGILARSKLLGLLSIITAPISWIFLFIIDALTGGFIPNPFGLFSGLSGPISTIAASTTFQGVVDMEQLAEVLKQVAIVLDLAVVETIAIFLGFFLSTLATGLWTKKEGKLSILSVITKPIAAIFVVLLIITVPFVYHGVANFADGGASLFAGLVEFSDAFGGLGGSGGSGAQAGGLDLSDPNVIANLTAAAQRAAEMFRRSAIAFDQLQGNFLAVLLINSLFPEGTSYNGLNMHELPLILDISEILADFSSELPSLILGYNALVEGFDRTFTVLGESDLGGGLGGSVTATYDPNFKVGLINISTAIDYFNQSKSGVISALTKAQGILTQVMSGDTGELQIIQEILDEANAGYGIILEVAAGSVYFLNATYKTTLAIEDLGDSDFIGSHQWLDNAASDVSTANTTMQSIDTSGLNRNSTLPFWGTVEIIKDMTNLLSWFSLAAANSTDAYTKIENVLVALNDLDFNSSDILNYDFSPLSANVTSAETAYNAAQTNINTATAISASLTTKSYHEWIDGSLGPMLQDFSKMLTQFSGNVTAVGNLITALARTVNSVESFTTGFKLFNQTYTEAHTNATTNSGGNSTLESILFFQYFTNDPRTNQSDQLMDFAITNASQGWFAVSNAEVISNDVKTSWQRTLYYPSPPTDPDPDADPKSIAGLAQGIKDTIQLFFSAEDLLIQDAETFAALIQEFFAYMETINLTDIFGEG